MGKVIDMSFDNGVPISRYLPLTETGRLELAEPLNSFPPKVGKSK